MTERTAQIYLDYVEAVEGQGDMTRQDAANYFGVHKSTATYHLERAVLEGYLVRYYSWTTKSQTGWAYRLPGANHRLPEPQAGDEVECHCRACGEPMFYTLGQGEDLCAGCDPRALQISTPPL